MPDSLHPPYNVVQPRQLDRWLDVNSQNGQLRRTQAYFIIPAFQVTFTFNQASDIIGDFWFLAPNSFSIIQTSASSIIPNEQGYVLCIAWIDSNNKVYRYKLNDDSRSTLDGIPLYNGELIRKNFRIEIWSCDVFHSNLAAMVNPLTIYTTVTGNVDYRYGVDFVLVDPLSIETNFNTPDLGDTDMALPFQFPNAIYTN